MNFWHTSAGSERLTLGVKMHSAAAFLSMPNSEGVVRGGNSDRGFNDKTTRGYPLRLTLTTRQVTDVVMYDEAILSVKGGRMVKDDHRPPTKREETRKTCALRYLDGCPDTKVIDPIKDNYPACTMPLSVTTPLHVTPEILCNQKYAQECVEHVALIRELLDQASLSSNPAFPHFFGACFSSTLFFAHLVIVVSVFVGRPERLTLQKLVLLISTALPTPVLTTQSFNNIFSHIYLALLLLTLSSQLSRTLHTCFWRGGEQSCIKGQPLKKDDILQEGGGAPH